MKDRTTIAGVLFLDMVLGLVAGALTELFTPQISAFINENISVVFGVGIIFLEGPSLVLSIVLPRRMIRIWVRNAIQAGGPFLAFAGYVLGYGLLLHPPFAIPWPWITQHARAMIGP